LKVIFIPEFIRETAALISHGGNEVPKITLGTKIVVCTGAGRTLDEVVL
jgi:predicted nucleotidyltransferase